MRSDYRPGRRTVILCVAASDSHVVANHLIAYLLRSRGFNVVNLGACTTVSDMCDALLRWPEAEAVLVGSLNGHARQDLADLPAAKERGAITCPVIVGGNLSVAVTDDISQEAALYALGVDHILRDPSTIPTVLDQLRGRPDGEVTAFSGAPRIEETADGHR
ncbi:cobalamin-dependent protein [Micromonospora sp. DT46]|uniref:cobalamin-dependent protein n=1 Tax=unclassified Micromonospora TaxID=2617518 RepID=UPI00124B1B28|nr:MULTISPECIES: cobalamin-dependent protein [unclassified Micromonospora]KAB1162350.1 methylaspartate mutase [Micromonospora sp. AMSO12t]WSG01413.1 cobalamin-dependent protein [Micromonospora sp. NBC_01740]